MYSHNNDKTVCLVVLGVVDVAIIVVDNAVINVAVIDAVVVVDVVDAAVIVGVVVVFVVAV